MRSNRILPNYLQVYPPVRSLIRKPDPEKMGIKVELYPEKTFKEDFAIFFSYSRPDVLLYSTGVSNRRLARACTRRLP